MAFGDKRGDWFPSTSSVTNPFAGTGSVAVTAGDLGICCYTERASLTANVCTDNLGNTWTPMTGIDAGNATLRVYYVVFPSSGTVTSVSMTTTASSADAAMSIIFFEGKFQSSPLDANPTAVQNDTTSPFTGPATGTLSQAEELVLSILTTSNGFLDGNYSVGSLTKYSDAGGSGANSVHVHVAGTVTSATTSVTPAWTTAAGPTSTVLATLSFKRDTGTPIEATFAGAGGLTANVSRFYAATDGSDAVLLFHNDGTNGSTTFVDATGRHTSFESDVVISTAQSKFGGASANHSNTYIALIDTSPDFAFGTGDYTVDLWARLKFTTGYNHSLYQGRVGSPNPNLLIWVDATNSYLHVTIGDGSSDFTIDGSTTLSADTWYHVAVTRTSNKTRLFLNGVQQGSTLSDSANYLSYYARPLIGPHPYECHAYIDEVRVIKGRAAWSENFTPNSSAYTYKHPIVAGTPVPDQVLLLHADGFVGDTAIVDATGRNSPFSDVASYPVKVSQTPNKFGGTSFYLAVGDAFGNPSIYVGNPPSSDFNFGTGDYTIDFWIYLSAQNSDRVLFHCDGFKLDISPSNVLRVFDWGFGTIITGTTAVTANGWHHIAITRASGNMRVFLNGTQEGSTASSTSSIAAGSQNDFRFGMGTNVAAVGDGYFDEIRVLKAKAQWTSNFTPPTSPYAAYALGGVGGLTANVETLRLDIPISATFAGAGGLTDQIKQRMAAFAIFAGAGSLTANLRKIIGAITFVGTGALTDQIKQRHAVRATFAGTGLLTADARKIINALTFAGVGGLTDQIKQRHAFAAIFAGTGALTDQIKQFHAITATFAGTGSLAADATIAVGNAYPIEATFEGVGGLTSDLLLTKPILAEFAGAGALSASMSMRMPIVATFAGAGSLTASAVKIISATFAGTGALTDQIKQRHAIFATFAGAGSLAASVTKNIGSVTFAGAGALTDQIKQRHVFFATFSGAGALTDQVKQRHAIFATFTGAGNLSALPVQRMAVQATFAGSGFLSAELNPPGAQTYPILATFAGTGSLAVATLVQRMAVTATFAGAGALTTNLLKAISATFAGAGNLTTSLTMRGNIAATFAGAGNWTAALRQHMTVRTTFAGVGSLAGDVTPPGTQIYSIVATFAGAGGFTADVINTKPISATFAGAGALTANAIRAKPITATFAGAGNFSANILLTKPLTANFAGAGSMTAAISSQRLAITAMFAGDSNLSVHAIQSMMVAAEFAGNGILVGEISGGQQPRSDSTTRRRGSNMGAGGVRTNQASSGRNNAQNVRRVNTQ